MAGARVVGGTKRKPRRARVVTKNEESRQRRRVGSVKTTKKRSKK